MYKFCRKKIFSQVLPIKKGITELNHLNSQQYQNLIAKSKYFKQFSTKKYHQRVKPLFNFSQSNKKKEVQMALMQEPINQINKFSAQKLANISQNLRIQHQQTSQTKSQFLKFDGKLHLDIKVDKLLLQIQQCKIQLAQILELYLSNSLNSIEIKQILLSNLKPSLSQEQKTINTFVDENGFLVIDQKKKLQNQKEKLSESKIQQKEQIQMKKNQIQQILTDKNKQQEIKTDDLEQKYEKIRRLDSYQINTFKQFQKQQLKKLKQQISQQKPHQDMTKSKQLQDKKNLAQKIIQSKSQAQKIRQNQIGQQKLEEVASNLTEQSKIKNSSQSQLLQKIEKQIINFKKTLMLRQAQLGMLIFITQNAHDQFFHQKYLEIYQSLKKYVIPLQKINQKINVFILEEVFQIQSQFLAEYSKHITEIKKRLEDFRKSQNQSQQIPTYSITNISNLMKQSTRKKLQKSLKSVYKLKIINSKIITIAQIFPYACIKDHNDLFSYSKSHQRWQKLIHNDIINYKIFGSPQKVRGSFDSLKNNLNIINASMNILNQNKDLSVFDYKNWGKIFQSTSKLLKVALFKTDAFHQASVMISQPDGKLAKQIWNLPENKTLQSFIAAVLPAIDFSEKIYIPRVLKAYFDSKGTIQLPNQFYITHITQYGNELYQKAPYLKKLPCRINAKYMINRRYETKTKSQIEKQQKEQSYSKKFFNTLNFMTKSLNPFSKKNSLSSTTAILHIHGGGFISMSSFIHQTYTRLWANNLEVPIISVDYGKAPQYPYPTGLYDCLEAYMWLRFVFRQIYDYQIQKVIIVGDSAGGNLAAALTTLLIQWNLPKPDGLVLVYPALNLNYNNYTPSLFHALNDMILPHTFLKICLQAYIKDTSLNPQTDSLLSPVVTSNQTLKKYPKTKIFVGGKDPFHDDCCKFVQRLNQAKQGIADLTIFDQFPHGFLQFDMTTNPHEQARKAIKQVQNALKQLIQANQK